MKFKYSFHNPKKEKSETNPKNAMEWVGIFILDSVQLFFSKTLIVSYSKHITHFFVVTFKLVATKTKKLNHRSGTPTHNKTKPSGGDKLSFQIGIPRFSY